MKKYEIEPLYMVKKRVKGKWLNLYRIRALRSFTTISGYEVEVGDFGGLVSGEENLSHNGLCWIDEHSYVTGDARVLEDACLEDSSVTNTCIVSESVQLISTQVSSFGSILGEFTITDSLLEGYVSIEGRGRIHCAELDGFRMELKMDWKETDVVNISDVRFKQAEVYLGASFDLKSSSGAGQQFTVLSKTTCSSASFRDDCNLLLRGRSNLIIGETVNPMFFDSNILILKDVNISGKPTVKGDFLIQDTMIRNYASILNEGRTMHTIYGSFLSDVSVIRFEEDLKEDIQEKICLSLDETVIFNKNS